MAEEIERENSRRTIELQSAARIGLAATISSPMMSDTTRRNRKMLILSSAVILLMVWVGIVPTEIKTIGVTFAPSGQRSLVVSGGLVVLYFLVMFFVQIRYDNTTWNERKVAALIAAQNANVDVSEYDYVLSKDKSSWEVQYGDHLLFMDQILPVILGFVALISVVYFVLV